MNFRLSGRLRVHKGDNGSAAVRTGGCLGADLPVTFWTIDQSHSPTLEHACIRRQYRETEALHPPCVNASIASIASIGGRTVNPESNARVFFWTFGGLKWIPRNLGDLTSVRCCTFVAALTGKKVAEGADLNGGEDA